MSVPVSWVLASGSALAMAISFLARLLYNSQQKQINLQQKQIDNFQKELDYMREISKQRNETIKAQNEIIANLQQDIKDLKKGCLAHGCHWVKRG